MKKKHIINSQRPRYAADRKPFDMYGRNYVLTCCEACIKLGGNGKACPMKEICSK